MAEDHADDRPAVILHIGYHKTATSWLQTKVFPRLGVRVIADEPAILEEFVAINPFAFDAARARNRIGAEPSDVLTIVSNERLSGHPDSAGYDSRDLADRLHAAFPDAAVVVTIRRQPEMALACYTQYVRAGGAESFRRFLRPPRATHRRAPHFDLRFLEYHHLIGYYRELFDKHRVLTLAYEQLREDPRAYVRQFSEFAGLEPPQILDTTSVNRSLCPLTLALKRRSNLIFSRDASNPTGLIDHSGLANVVARRFNRLDRRLPESIRRLGADRLRSISAVACADRFRESNRLTQSQTGLPLDELGYEV